MSRSASGAPAWSAFSSSASPWRSTSTAHELWDVWVLIALVLWFVAGGAGEQLPAAHRKAGGAPLPPAAVGAHWFTVVLVLLLLADMVWKPWA